MRISGKLMGLAVCAVAALQATASDGVEFVSDDPVLMALWGQAEQGMARGLGSLDPHVRFWALRSTLATGQDPDGVARALEGMWEGHGRIYWPLLLHRYYAFTGDRDRARRLTAQRLEAVMESLAAEEGNSGLLAGVDTPFGSVDDDSPRASANLIYWAALEAASDLARDFEVENSYGAAAEALAARIQESFGMADGRLRESAEDTAPSMGPNALAAALGFPAPEGADFLSPIRDTSVPPRGALATWSAEACYRGGDAGLGYRVLAFAAQSEGLEPPVASKALIVRYVMGFEPIEPGWPVVLFSPGLPLESGMTRLRIAVPSGQLEAAYDPQNGYQLRLPPGVEVRTNLAEDIPLNATRDEAMAMETMTAEQEHVLRQHGWFERVGDQRAVWISVDEQMLRILEGTKVIFQTRCGTAEAGTGSQAGSNKTPLGWHTVDTKFGDDAPWGQVFRARQATNEIWQPGQDTKEDLVLTRILWLDGEEPGKNKGGDVDSKSRYIYIHGTNGEYRIGEPSSHGCIRLRNDDVILAYEMIPEGTPVLITERTE